jgi:hypothetical protein
MSGFSLAASANASLGDLSTRDVIMTLRVARQSRLFAVEIGLIMLCTSFEEPILTDCAVTANLFFVVSRTGRPFGGRDRVRLLGDVRLGLSAVRPFGMALCPLLLTLIPACSSHCFLLRDIRQSLGEQWVCHPFQPQANMEAAVC